MQLADKVAVITGAQQGIGRATALAYAREGASVVVNYLDDEAAAESIAAKVRQRGGRSFAVQADIAKPPDVQRLFATCDELGGVDILVNNAAIFPRVRFLDMTESEWDEMIAVNLKGTFLCTQAGAKRMVEQGRGGCIINLSSRAAFLGSVRGVHYVAAKAGVLGLTRAAALELAPYRIRVNAIAPGLTDTAQPRYGMTEEEIRRAGEMALLGRIASPDDIADTAVFLASDASRHMTGQTLHVNGGEYMT